MVRVLAASAEGAPVIGMGALCLVTYARRMEMEKLFSGLTSVI